MDGNAVYASYEEANLEKFLGEEYSVCERCSDERNDMCYACWWKTLRSTIKDRKISGSYSICNRLLYLCGSFFLVIALPFFIVWWICEWILWFIVKVIQLVVILVLLYIISIILLDFLLPHVVPPQHTEKLDRLRNMIPPLETFYHLFSPHFETDIDVSQPLVKVFVNTDGIQSRKNSVMTCLEFLSDEFELVLEDGRDLRNDSDVGSVIIAQPMTERGNVDFLDYYLQRFDHLKEFTVIKYIDTEDSGSWEWKRLMNGMYGGKVFNVIEDIRFHVDGCEIEQNTMSYLRSCL